MSRIKQVTQLTNDSTSVECNSYDGIIETVALELGTGESTTFTVNNNKVRRTSTVLITGIYAGAGLPVFSLAAVPTNGAFEVTISNLGVDDLDASASIQFKITHN
jgi:hypothetical protein